MTATLAPSAGTAAPVPPAPTRSRGELVALAALLVGTAVLYLWDLGASGFANSYYAAAVQSMTQSWKAFLFGSLDAGNAITVDKPPASLWVMALSARIFGFSPWSMLVPQALMGLGSVALIHAAVRRVSGPVAGLLAGAVLALTPVAVLMFRFNNPDALLVLLMVAAAYATVRAIERAGTRWLLLAGVLIGFAFLTKMAQAFLVLPAFVSAYLVCAPTGLWRRVRQLLGAAVAVVVSAGWYVALVELWPAQSRPYIGGSEDNSLLELALGYNGLGRIFGGDGNGGGAHPTDLPTPTGAPAGELTAIGGPGGGGGFGGTPGIGRMFNDTAGGQVSWLLPAALALLVAGLWLTRRAPRTDPTRASLLLWGGWTVVTALVFSFAQGTFHEYYTVALAPPIAALVAIGGRELWRHRASWAARAALAVVVAGTAAWAWVLLGRSPDFLPWLRWAVVALAVVAVVAVLVPGAATRRIAALAALVAVLSGIAAPVAYALDTAGTAHTGSTPSAGPAVSGGRGGAGGDGGAMPAGAPTADGQDARGAGPDGGPGFPGAGGGPGGAVTADAELVAALRGAGTRWAAATVGAQQGGGLALASGTTVMSIGGFTGSDPAPTLEQFQAHVAAGEVRYFLAGGGFGGGGRVDLPGGTAAAPGTTAQEGAAGSSGAQDGRSGPGGRGGPGSAISAWVEQNFAPVSIGGQLVYDLKQPIG
ncbi:ArnT family glycosyltransferase [Pseudonocardia humida]|uniref:Glycosyltransferase family 39 protein n=1 Tax=Pseudonocardia humida TaxID=2800819 RepID=A0ABT1A374_9PSEU|nr:glycosyltransferase family 39 protein [Pseudonocardia humida]MCO1657447.1 glycosyltransferase family 39 protein [Pseudonocardia humida]